MTGSPVQVHLIDGYLGPALDPAQWDELLNSGPTRTVFLTWAYQKTWWDVFGRGRLILLIAQRDGHPVAAAPLFCDGGMVFFVGSGGSDYLDFVGDADAGALVSLLRTARELAPDFGGFRFYHIPEHSPTVLRLKEAATALRFDLYEEGELPAPRLTLDDPGTVRSVCSKKSLVRHENALQREGALEFFHSNSAVETTPWLDAFYEQHVARWSATPYPSLFLDPTQRRFYRALTEAGSRAGWLRFSRLDWNSRAVAFHFGFHYGGVFLWYKPSFEVELARRSPGEVLLSRLLRASAAEGASVFDFGIGEEAFKRRFANSIPVVRTLGLYPKGRSS